ncbi:hypothetical protein FNH22_11240 [Fulvivirga sp. M361]|uniref:DoxX family protein n=1 Tax=Fulvivirga sp. M361 TaxID=2594266 RepID=UPI001179C14F|nr:hypothetical protein [Fulvivirga sp. M361]TRX59091.1 hypothetical protein FNH22_11240 [Fulvivirga sp. M361]
MKKISFYLLIAFFVLAGLNHFRDPAFYYPLIPPYLPFPKVINVISGILEVILGLGLIWSKVRNDAAYALIFLLILFIPSHVYFIQVGGCVESGLCVPLWVAWLRLVIIHPLLIAWVWMHRKG